MDRIELVRALPSAVTIAAVPDDADEARECLRQYAEELARRFPEGFDPATLLPPGALGDGTFLLARDEDRPIGCGLWQRTTPAVAEIRHLWVGGEARGRGLGRRLLTALEADAAAHGVTTVRLGTHPRLPEAIALYRAGGYREIPPFGGSPYNQLAFEKPC